MWARFFCERNAQTFRCRWSNSAEIFPENFPASGKVLLIVYRVLDIPGEIGSPARCNAGIQRDNLFHRDANVNRIGYKNNRN
jgi:hypothetical protein